MSLLALLLACTRDDVAPDPHADGPIEPYDPLEWVDPFIATGGIGAQVTGLNPGASMPFGLTLVGPDTRSSVWGDPSFYHFGGYHYDDDEIEAFAHTHAHGMGVNDFGGVALLPRGRWDDRFTRGEQRAAPFVHEREWASPGHYGVEYTDDGTVVDIVATTHGAHHRIGFAADAEPTLIIDLGHRLGTVDIPEADAAIELGAGRITGFQLLSGSYSRRFGGLQTHFVVQLDPPPVGSGVWHDPDSPTPGATSVEGPEAGLWVTWPVGTREVDVRVALSYVDHDGATANLEAELIGVSFEEQLARASTTWRDELSRVRVRGGSDAQKRTWHTADYHARLMPSRQDDVDGRYRGIDGLVHTTDHPTYSDMSLWDTFRTLHPWLTLVDPDRQRDMLRSLVRMTRDGGSVPRWPLGHGYTGGMVGSPADQVFAGSYLKGITTGWDVALAWEASLAHATGPVAHASRAGIEAYVERNGWLAVEDAGSSVSRTLEYAWSDHALSRWGRALGHQSASAALDARSRGWRELYDPTVGFFQGRTGEGEFLPFTHEFNWEDVFVEGNFWHYVWYVPWDVDAMVEVQHEGDLDAFHDRLASFWDAVFAEPDDALPDDHYWHGNEPVLHYVALGSLSGAPDLTADAARWLLTNRYNDTPLGLDGNDDSGTLSAWYLFTAMGLYPIAGTPTYALTSPVFSRIEIDHPEGLVVVEAPRTSDAVRYLHGARVGGAALARPVVDHEALIGHTLELTLSAEPDGWEPR